MDGRNSAPPGMYKSLINNGINYQPQLVGERRISEPSTVSPKKIHPSSFKPSKNSNLLPPGHSSNPVRSVEQGLKKNTEHQKKKIRVQQKLKRIKKT